jgi:urate oxidase
MFKEALGIKGNRWSFYNAKGANLNERELEIARKIPFWLPDSFKGGVLSALIGREVGVFSTHNLVPTVGRQQIAKAISANISTVTEIKITHQELGTSTQAPANGDTGLITPTASTRKVISSLSFSTNKITITAFWAAGEATGTWREFGTFINGTATSNSGVLFNRVAINVTVTASNSLTIDGEVTIS